MLSATVVPNSQATIYGSDDRVSVDNSIAPPILQLSQAIATVVLASDLHSGINGKVLVDSHTLGHEFGLCPGERFFSEPTMGDCTGFLISPTRLVTAGHCFDSDVRCETMAWIFDYRLDKIGWDGRQVSLDQEKIYFCKRIVTMANNQKQDFAVIELDREIRDRQPLKITAQPRLTAGDSIFTLGFPSGLPMKWASAGQVRQTAGIWVGAEIDTFTFNSGSPVFAQSTNEVVGILIDGDEDYRYNHKMACSQPFRCSPGGCSGETFISSEIIAPFAKPTQNQYSPAIATSAP